MGRYIIFGGIIGFFVGYVIFFIFNQELSNILIQAFPVILSGIVYSSSKGSPLTVIFNFVPGVFGLFGAILGFAFYFFKKLLKR